MRRLQGIRGRKVERRRRPDNSHITCAVNRDPATSVLNGHNQSHDVPNLFVTDGASMTSSACQNPSLTYMALTARACAYAVEQMTRGEL